MILKMKGICMIYEYNCKTNYLTPAIKKQIILQCCTTYLEIPSNHFKLYNPHNYPAKKQNTEKILKIKSSVKRQSQCRLLLGKPSPLSQHKKNVLEFNLLGSRKADLARIIVFSSTNPN